MTVSDLPDAFGDENDPVVHRVMTAIGSAQIAGKSLRSQAVAAISAHRRAKAERDARDAVWNSRGRTTVVFGTHECPLVPLGSDERTLLDDMMAAGAERWADTFVAQNWLTPPRRVEDWEIT